MASYPTAVKTFTTKNAGDTIQPGHMNDLQDEVAAIEGGLLNGTAPLNSSNSTVANLSVTGASTLANLQAGDSTIAGTLTVTTIISTSIAGGGVTSYVRAYAGSPAGIATASTFTRLALDQEIADLLGEWDSTAFLFTQQSSGYYLVTGRAQNITGAAGDYQVALEVNSTIVAKSGEMYAAGVAYGWGVVTSVLNLSSGSAGALAFKAYCASTARCSSGQAGTSLEIIKLF